MMDARDHAAHRRRILQRADAIDLVEAKAPQRRALIGLTTGPASDLAQRDGLGRTCVGVIGVWRPVVGLRGGGHKLLLPRVRANVAPAQHVADLAAAARRGLSLIHISE